MKVLYDHQVFSFQEYGGISRYFYELMNVFEKKNCMNFTVSVRCTNNQYLFDLKSLDGLKKCTASAATPKSLFFSVFGKKKDVYQINREFSEQVYLKQDYDVFHPTYFNPYFLKFESGKPFILTVHDMIYEMFPEYFPVTDKTISMKKKLIEKADEIICVSENTRQDLLKFYNDLDSSKVHVIYHGNSLIPGKQHEPLNPNENISFKSNFLLYVGPRWSYKNFYFFVVSSVPLLEKYPWLVIVCAGGGGFTPDELVFFRQLGIADRISHFPVDDTQLATLYKSSLAFIFPSIYEGFGLPILEAFACSCPVVCSNSGSLPEIAQDAAVYFSPKDVASMQHAIESVIIDPEIRHTMIKKGLNTVKKFRWEKAAKCTKKVYEKACSH